MTCEWISDTRIQSARNTNEPTADDDNDFHKMIFSLLLSFTFNSMALTQTTNCYHRMLFFQLRKSVDSVSIQDSSQNDSLLRMLFSFSYCQMFCQMILYLRLNVKHWTSNTGNNNGLRTCMNETLNVALLRLYYGLGSVKWVVRMNSQKKKKNVRCAVSVSQFHCKITKIKTKTTEIEK